MPETPLHVLILDHTGELGGAERVMLEVLERLPAHGVRATVACSPAGPLRARVEALGVPVWPLGLDEAARTLSREAWAAQPWRVAWAARALLRDALALARRARREGVTLLHTNTLKGHLLGTLVGRLTGLPVAWHMHDMPSARGDTRQLLTWAAALWRPACVLAVSRAAAADLPPALQALARVVPNGLDLAAFDEAAARRVAPVAWPPGVGPLLGSVSWLIPWKGFDVLLRAMPRIVAVHPDVRLAIVGDAIFQWRDERARLEALAVELGIASRVAFLGAREDVPALLSCFDVFVHPALQEPFGRVLLEAMAARRAVVACEAGGVPEVVVPGETALLVPPGEVDALAGAVLELLATPARAARMGEAGRRRVGMAFGLDHQVTQVIGAWSAALTTPRPRRG
ncbi:MAG: glycosyltransferase family 4 protein [Candidatus Sericytochromatia bacterium]|nr:glycosyltransferase family 4 protein [Candidatus Sericytochromatia bacterium]